MNNNLHKNNKKKNNNLIMMLRIISPIKSHKTLPISKIKKRTNSEIS